MALGGMERWMKIQKVYKGTAIVVCRQPTPSKKPATFLPLFSEQAVTSTEFVDQDVANYD